MDTSTLPQIFSFYPWACVVLAIYSILVCVFSFIGLLITLRGVLFQHERFSFYYIVQFLLAGAAACRYYDLFDDMDSTLPLIMVDQMQALVVMSFSLFLPVIILTVSGLLLSRFSPPNNPVLNAAVKKKLKELWQALTQTQNAVPGRVSRKPGQHLALIIGSEDQNTLLIKRSLEKEKFIVIQSRNSAEGLSLAALNYPDLVILDMGPSDMEGSAVLARIREWSKSPTIILNASIEMSESGRGDNDYYLTNSFSAQELADHIAGALRHLHHNNQQRDRSIFQNSIFKLDKGARTLTIRKREIHLTPHEFHLLSYFVNHPGQIVTLKMIHQEFWGKHMDEEALRRYIHNLRYKVELDPVMPKYIVTEPGLGYRLNLR